MLIIISTLLFKKRSNNQVTALSYYIQTTLNNNRKALSNELIELEDESKSIETLIMDISENDSSPVIGRDIERFASFKTIKD